MSKGCLVTIYAPCQPICTVHSLYSGLAVWCASIQGEDAPRPGDEVFVPAYNEKGTVERVSGTQATSSSAFAFVFAYG